MDYEFSRLSMTDHWRAGYEDAGRALRHKEIFEPNRQDGFQAFDFSEGPDEEKHQKQSPDEGVTPNLLSVPPSVLSARSSAK